MSSHRYWLACLQNKGCLLLSYCLLGIEMLPPCAATNALNWAILSTSACARADSLVASSSFLTAACLLRYSCFLASLHTCMKVSYTYTLLVTCKKMQSGRILATCYGSRKGQQASFATRHTYASGIHGRSTLLLQLQMSRLLP